MNVSSVATTLIVLLFILVLPQNSSAQVSHQPEVALSYFGEFIGHPGVKAGIAFPLLGRHEPGKRHSLLIGGGNVGAYYHRGNHTGVFLEGELGYRFVTKRGFKLETLLTAGYHRSFFDGPVYSVNESTVSKHNPFFGQNTAHASWKLGFGKQLRNSPLGWHVRPGFMIRTPHNSSVIPHLFIETGFTYRLPTR